MENNKFMTLGEIMLRLTTPNYNDLKDSKELEVSFGGAEANIAIELANLGIDTSYFTVLPNNKLGDKVISILRENNIDTSKIIKEDGRLGIYFLEKGFGVRPSNVVYDRKNSAFALHDFKDIDYIELLQDVKWLHLSGITPALSEEHEEFILNLLKAAKILNITVSYDGNYRKALWEARTEKGENPFQKARDCMTKFLPYVDVLIGTEPYNLLDENGNDLKEGKDDNSREDQKKIFEEFAKQYGIKTIVRHVRKTHSANKNSLKGYLYTNGEMYETEEQKFDILDRVGGGDAFSSGIIYALMNNYNPQDTINFGIASSIYKHTVNGDYYKATKEDVEKVAQKTYDVKR